MQKLHPVIFLILFIQILHAQTTTFKRVPYKVSIIPNSNGPVIHGYLQSLTDTSIYISPAKISFDGYTNNSNAATIYSYETIQEVRLRRKGATGRGILIGTIAGAAAGAVMGLASGDDTKNNMGGCFICFTAGEKATAGGIVLGLTGGVIGGIVGALAHKTFIINEKKEKFNELKWSLIH